MGLRMWWGSSSERVFIAINSMIMRTLLYKWFVKFYQKELKEEFDAYDGGGYLNAQMDIAKKLISRGMDMAEVADIVGLDEDDLEENFGNE